MNKKGISPWIAVLCIAVIVFACVGTYYMVKQLQVQEKPKEEEVFYGTLSITVNEDNYLSRGSSVSTTSDSYVAYHPKGKSLDESTEADFVSGVSFTVGTAKDYSLSENDNGHLWFKAYTGTDFFLHIQGTIDANDEIGDTYKYADVDNDNRLEVVFDIDVSNYRLSDVKQSLNIVVMVVQEDTSLALNAPADQDSIGTGTKTGTIEWQITGIAEKYGASLARIYFVSNESTFESYATITSVTIAGVGTFSGGDITGDSGAKTWYVDIGVSDYREPVYCPLLLHEAGGTSYVAVTVSWESYFTSASQALSITPYVQTMGADEAVDSAITDSGGCTLGG